MKIRRPVLLASWCQACRPSLASSRPSQSQHQFRRLANTARLADDAFRYTSGRWLYNERKRLEERCLHFDMAALRLAAARSLNRSEEDIISIIKLAEGGFNRVFTLTMRDGLQVIARLPYPSNQPRCLATASEVATMNLVRSHGVPTPAVYGHSTDCYSFVGSEYILMEKMSGRCLADVWFELSDSQRVKVLGEIVDLEVKLFNIDFPAYGSIYQNADLPDGFDRVQIGQREGKFCVGPDVSLKHWFGTRSYLDFRRGPTAEKEVMWLRTHGRPRLPFDREFREMFDYQKTDPKEHLQALEAYLEVAPYIVPSEKWLHRPILRHPDLTPNNIFVDEDYRITGIIDWQHASVLSLFLHAGIPKSFQNYGDPQSEELQKPKMPSPDDLDEDEDDYRKDLELYRRRHAHYYYVAATASKLNMHWKAMTQARGLLRRKIYEHAAEPWEGNSIPLKAALVQLMSDWPALGDPNVACPIDYSEAEVHDIMQNASAQEEMDRQMAILRDVIGVTSDGWMPCESYGDAVDRAAEMKQSALRDADDEVEREMIRAHWPFDDFDEDS
ncbi:uncharacterized protein MYCGRDRAFT_38168 [Zymoseptoria tritici IPO323]|uniref:Aminoglycoside phosphotransferase domain-containing protein n=1 Tax=Zymoseptoria tritici (strain CBS 115943 / IPO323) TaxID=336722 RepID=F9X783_ZYMTI|nr:uncharacterized protein MYCGRDRAFT_38168 [Zymoseptoria tritici IPO323]EGP88766.1 hypothetical protein MYCGRDRAFT_38168 [Zymoseptoria tritici IPO323]